MRVGDDGCWAGSGFGRPDPNKALLARIAELEIEVRVMREFATAAVSTVASCKHLACESGMSWSGYNIVGDRKSIDHVKAAVHYYDQMGATQAGWAERLKAATASGAKTEREECAVIADNTAKYSLDPGRARTASQIAVWIRTRGGPA